MKLLINNWVLIICAIALLSVIIIAVVKFFKSPTKEQIRAVKEWLVYAVMLAEKELKEKTGQEKLRMVYDMFLTKFSWLVKIVTFETFSKWVDEALEEFKIMLKSNKNLQEYIGT